MLLVDAGAELFQVTAHAAMVDLRVLCLATAAQVLSVLGHAVLSKMEMTEEAKNHIDLRRPRA